MYRRNIGPVRIQARNRRLVTFPHRMWFVYAGPGGGPVLKGTQSMWKYVNGVYLNTDRGYIMITFRRHVL